MYKNRKIGYKISTKTWHGNGFFLFILTARPNKQQNVTNNTNKTSQHYISHEVQKEDAGWE